jgi:hypothetical protein
LKAIEKHNNFTFVKTAENAKDITTNSNSDFVKPLLLPFRFVGRKIHKSNVDKILALLSVPFTKRLDKVNLKWNKKQI